MSKEENIKTVEEVAETVTKPYTLRNLKDKDLWPLLQIFKKIGIKDFKEAFYQVLAEGKNLNEVGIMVGLDMVDILIGNIGKCENEVYALWSDISNIPVEEIKEMEFGTLPMMIYDSLMGVKNTSFFKVLFKLL